MKDKLKPYADAMKIVASECNVPVIDLHKSSGALFQRLGDAASRFINPDNPDGRDRTHFSPEGITSWSNSFVGICPA